MQRIHLVPKPTRLSSSAAIAQITPWSMGMVGTAVLSLANHLAAERYNGARVYSLDASAQRDLCIDAADKLEWYADGRL